MVTDNFYRMSYELTPKFEKELIAFFDWVNNTNDYIVYSKNDNNKLNWSKELLTTFTETPRKKLDGFLKNVFATYIIKDKQNEIIYSHINVINAYKEYKTPTKSDNKKIDNLCKSFNLTLNINNKDNIDNIDNTETTDTDNIDRIDTDNIVKINKSSNSKDIYDISGNGGNIINIDNELDTTKTWFLCNLEYTTEQLMKVFKDPKYTGDETSNHRYEWKFTLDNHVFSIYDWKFDKNDVFYDIKEADWFLCGNSNKYNKKIIALLDNLLLK